MISMKNKVDFCEYSNDDKMSFIQKARDEVSF